MNLLEQIREALKENKVEKKRVYDILAEEGETYRQADDIAIRNELGEKATLEGVRALKAEAEQGRQYTADLIDDAVKARVKVQGDGFKEESYRQMLARSNDLEYIKDEIESYNKMASDRFVAGRQTEKDDPSRGQEDEDVVVSETYKGEDK